MRSNIYGNLRCICALVTLENMQQKNKSMAHTGIVIRNSIHSRGAHDDPRCERGLEASLVAKESDTIKISKELESIGSLIAQQRELLRTDLKSMLAMLSNEPDVVSSDVIYRSLASQLDTLQQVETQMSLRADELSRTNAEYSDKLLQNHAAYRKTRDEWLEIMMELKSASDKLDVELVEGKLKKQQ